MCTGVPESIPINQNAIVVALPCARPRVGPERTARFVTEFGTVKEADQFKALYAYSPYHHVQDGTNYPPILYLTGDSDPRVGPLNSRKMTARLQASGTQHLVLLRTSGNSGHGIGTALNELVSQQADVLAFPEMKESDPDLAVISLDPFHPAFRTLGPWSAASQIPEV